MLPAVIVMLFSLSAGVVLSPVRILTMAFPLPAAGVALHHPSAPIIFQSVFDVISILCSEADTPNVRESADTESVGSGLHPVVNRVTDKMIAHKRDIWPKIFKLQSYIIVSVCKLSHNLHRGTEEKLWLSRDYPASFRRLLCL